MTEKERRHTLESWLGQFKGLIFKIVRSYAAGSMDQEDLFQEIAMQLWNSIPSFRGESSVTTWLYRVSLNTALKWMRSERKHHYARENMDEVDRVLREKPETDERLSWLYDEIAKLDAIDRSIAVLLLEGLSYKEIAEIVGISESNTGVKINRIKKHLIVQSEKNKLYGI